MKKVALLLVVILCIVLISFIVLENRNKEDRILSKKLILDTGNDAQIKKIRFNPGDFKQTSIKPDNSGLLKTHRNIDLGYKFTYPSNLHAETTYYLGKEQNTTIYNYDVSKAYPGDYSPTRDKGLFKIEILEIKKTEDEKIVSIEELRDFLAKNDDLDCSEANSGYKIIISENVKDLGDYQRFDRVYSCTEGSRMTNISYFVTKNGTTEFILGLDENSGKAAFDQIAISFELI